MSADKLRYRTLRFRPPNWEQTTFHHLVSLTVLAHLLCCLSSLYGCAVIPLKLPDKL